MDNLNNIPNAGNWGDAASKLNDNFNKVKQAVTTVENTSKNNKGYFTSLSALNTAFPSPKAGQTAYVYNEASSTNYYTYNAVNGAWASSTVEAPPVSVPITNYAEHGYTGTPKTLKEVDDSVSQLEGDFNIVEQTIYNNRLIFSAEDFAYGTHISPGVITWDPTSKIRIATINKYPVKKGDILKSLSSDVKVLPIIYDSTGELISHGEFEYEHTIQFDCDIVVYARLEPDADILDISFVAQNINVINTKLASVDKVNEIKQNTDNYINHDIVNYFDINYPGLISVVTGLPMPHTSYQYTDFIPVKESMSFLYTGTCYDTIIVGYNNNKEFTGIVLEVSQIDSSYLYYNSPRYNITNYPFVIPSGVSYIRAVHSHADNTENIQAKLYSTTKNLLLDIIKLSQNEVDDKINSVEEAIYDRLIFSAEDFAYGTHLTPGIIDWDETLKNRIATIDKYSVKKGDILKSLSSDVKVLPIMYDSTGELISYGVFEYEHTIQFDCDLVIYARLEPDADILDISFVAQNIDVGNDRISRVEYKINSLDDKVNNVIDNGTVIVSNDEVYLGAKKFLLWNPYKEIPASPIKIDGQLHTHTSQSDGGDPLYNSVLVEQTPEEVARVYSACNYKFWTITDHNRVTPKPANNDDLGLIWIGESYESTGADQHMCVYMGELETYDSTGLPVRQGDTNLFGVTSMYGLNKSMNEIIEHYATIGNLINYAHPFWPNALQTEEKVKSAIAGIGLTEVLNQELRSDDAWDWQLQEGHKVFGIAVDDYHNNPGAKERYGWVEAWVTAETKQEVLKALFTGCFVAANGVVPLGGVEGDGINGITITSLSFINGVYSIQTDIPCTFKFINQTGVSTPVKTVTSANSATYELSISDRYVRCEISADSGVAGKPWIKWTQPVFVVGEKLSYEIK